MHTITLPISLSDISHELRTALTGILNMTELLKEASLTSEQQKFLEVINISGIRILDLTNLLTEKRNNL